MRVIRLSILIIFLMPALLIMGGIASQTAVLNPLQAGDYNIDFNKIARCGKTLQSLTQEFVTYEIDILQKIIISSNIKEAFKGLDKKLF